MNWEPWVCWAPPSPAMAVLGLPMWHMGCLPGKLKGEVTVCFSVGSVIESDVGLAF